MKKLLLLFLFIFVLTPIKTFANSEYGIIYYNIDIKVSKENTFKIQEDISAYFNYPKHGIYRKIPIRNNVMRADGTMETNIAKITNIKVSDNYEISTENGKKTIKIGDANKTLTGMKNYRINYTYNIGNDKSNDYDEFYFNLIGNEWDTSIEGVSFSIEMPKAFDESKLGFTVGRAGSENYEGIEYNVVGNKIVGKYLGKLKAYEGLTIRLQLPEGYFEKQSMLSLMTILSFILPLILIIISFILWKKYGKDDIITETVEFYPPEGYNSAEVGFMYRGRADKKDVISLLIYLANKGYLKIAETKGKFGKKDFTITKLKAYDGNNGEEKFFFAGLFERGHVVTKKDLKNKFYETISFVTTLLNKMRDKIYDKKSLSLTIVPVVFIIFNALLIYANCKDGLFGLPIEYGIIATLVIASLVQARFVFIMKKRNQFGNEMLGKIRGFKNFLETAEKDQLEALIEKEPEYFYNILPFTYVLGVSDKWIKKFESIAIQPPEWYDGYDAYNTMTMMHFMSHTMTSMQSAMTSSPSSSSSSGGGFSGGGSGGGGGGSW